MDEAGPWVACQEMGAQALARLSVSFQGWVLEEGPITAAQMSQRQQTQAEGN